MPDDLAKARYCRHLRVLAQLRDLNIKITKIMGDVSNYFSDDRIATPAGVDVNFV